MTLESRRRTGSDLSNAAAALTALAAPNRVRLLAEVIARQARGEDCSPRAVAIALDRSPKAVSKDAVRLSECGVLSFQGHTMSVDLSPLRSTADAIVAELPIVRLLADDPDLARFFKHGRLVTTPESAATLERIARLFVRLLPMDRSLAEAEVNELLAQVTDDPATWRRFLVDLGFATRKGSSDYRRVR